MTVIENSKLTMVGGVGSSVAYAALTRGSARHVALYDIDAAKAEAEVLDLAHGAQFTDHSDIVGGGDVSVAATGLSPERLFASGTVLNTSRPRWVLAQRAGVSPASVHAHIVGEHGDTQFPLWSRASSGTMPLLEWEMPDDARLAPSELDRTRWT